MVDPKAILTPEAVQEGASLASPIRQIHDAAPVLAQTGDLRAFAQSIQGVSGPERAKVAELMQKKQSGVRFTAGESIGTLLAAALPAIAGMALGGTDALGAVGAAGQGVLAGVEAQKFQQKQEREDIDLQIQAELDKAKGLEGIAGDLVQQQFGLEKARIANEPFTNLQRGSQVRLAKGENRFVDPAGGLAGRSFGARGPVDKKTQDRARELAPVVESIAVKLNRMLEIEESIAAGQRVVGPISDELRKLAIAVQDEAQMVISDKARFGKEQVKRMEELVGRFSGIKPLVQEKLPFTATSLEKLKNTTDLILGTGLDKMDSMGYELIHNHSLGQSTASSLGVRSTADLLRGQADATTETRVKTTGGMLMDKNPVSNKELDNTLLTGTDPTGNNATKFWSFNTPQGTVSSNDFVNSDGTFDTEGALDVISVLANDAQLERLVQIGVIRNPQAIRLIKQRGQEVRARLLQEQQ